MDTVLRWILILLAVYLAGGVALYVLQRFFLYFPRSYVPDSGLTELTLAHDNAHLHGYLANPGRKHLLFYYGGNAEQLANGISQLARHLPDVTIIGFDYRGYGKSEGKPTEQSLYRDALLQYDELAGQYQSVSLFGRSLGSAVATCVATQRAVKTLILVTPIDSVTRIAASRYWFYPVRWLLKDRFDSVSRAHEIDVPVLMLTGADDTLVPEGRLQTLKNAFAGPVTWTSLPGVSHNTIQESPRFGSVLSHFLQQGPAEAEGDTANQRRVYE